MRKLNLSNNNSLGNVGSSSYALRFLSLSSPLSSLLIIPLMLMLGNTAHAMLESNPASDGPTRPTEVSKNSVAQNAYCRGWEQGWEEGWKYVKGEFSIPPIAPICPIPEVGRDRFTDGYNRGFVAGKRAAEK